MRGLQLPVLHLVTDVVAELAPVERVPHVLLAVRGERRQVVVLEPQLQIHKRILRIGRDGAGDLEGGQGADLAADVHAGLADARQGQVANGAVEFLDAGVEAGGERLVGGVKRALLENQGSNCDREWRGICRLLLVGGRAGRIGVRGLGLLLHQSRHVKLAVRADHQAGRQSLELDLVHCQGVGLQRKRDPLDGQIVPLRQFVVGHRIRGGELRQRQIAGEPHQRRARVAGRVVRLAVEAQVARIEHQPELLLDVGLQRRQPQTGQGELRRPGRRLQSAVRLDAHRAAAAPLEFHRRRDRRVGLV